MKLISLATLAIYLAVVVQCQKFQQHFSIPPQFQIPNTGVFTTDNTLYLPPESHTTIPYFPVKNVNELTFPYLPATGTKVPSVYPTPFPIHISSINTTDVDNLNTDGEKVKTSSPRPHLQQNRFNITESTRNSGKREMESNTQHFQQPIERMDMKFPNQFFERREKPIINQTPATRRMIISAETQRNDQGPDQLKTASFLGPHYIQAPNIFISSTTEPAIPILRLSNEMDLDGSFSYEALGADQTHYVQHSRMENTGTEKEEQVVEGSYSYVGDNGQTYTVHYIADSNGFRASGDHLPVPPPIPEIIQRSIQYNMAEESKKPSHSQSWQDEGKGTESPGSNNNHQVSFSPPRNLFPGRTPESFSHSFSQGNNLNNLLSSASSQIPIQTALEFTKEQLQKANGGPISPQITFLASQGAHVPSLHVTQQSISRMSNSDKPSLPQIMNYEAGEKEPELDTKRSWRWQYGSNLNNPNQNINKNLISRSSSDGDEVMINFNDMTPDQYTKILQTQLNLESNDEEVAVNNTDNNYSLKPSGNDFMSAKEYENQNKNTGYQQISRNEDPNLPSITKYSFPVNEHKNVHDKTSTPITKHTYDVENRSQMQANLLTQNNFVPTSQINTQSYDYNDNTLVTSKTQDFNSETNSKFLVNGHKNVHVTTSTPITKHTYDVENRSQMRANLLTQNNFVPTSQTITQSYDYNDNTLVTSKTQDFNSETNSKLNVRNQNSIDDYLNNIAMHNYSAGNNNMDAELKSGSDQNSIYTTTPESSINVSYISHNYKNEFRPILDHKPTSIQGEEQTTEADINIKDIFENNIFLKKLSQSVITQSENNDKEYDKQILELSKNILNSRSNTDNKIDKSPQPNQFYVKGHLNDIEETKKRFFDKSDILDYISLKNHFESNKIKPKTNVNPINLNQNELYIPIQQENFAETHKEHHTDEHTQENYQQHHTDDLKYSIHNSNEKIRGVLKNYKVLQRNNNPANFHRNNPIRRELTLGPTKTWQTPNYPPLGRAGPSMKSYLPPVYL